MFHDREGPLLRIHQNTPHKGDRIMSTLPDLVGQAGIIRERWFYK